MTALLFWVLLSARDAVIGIICGTVRKSHSWKQAENEIITVIKPEVHILHHHVTGKTDSLDGPDSLRRHREAPERMC